MDDVVNQTLSNLEQEIYENLVVKLYKFSFKLLVSVQGVPNTIDDVF